MHTDQVAWKANPVEKKGIRERFPEAVGVAIGIVVWIVAVAVCQRLGWTGRRSVQGLLALLFIVFMLAAAAVEDLISGLRNRELGPARHKRDDAGEG